MIILKFYPVRPKSKPRYTLYYHLCLKCRNPILNLFPITPCLVPNHLFSKRYRVFRKYCMPNFKVSENFLARREPRYQVYVIKRTLWKPILDVFSWQMNIKTCVSVCNISWTPSIRSAWKRESTHKIYFKVCLHE